MPPKPIAIKCWLRHWHYFCVRNKHFKSKYTPKVENLVPFFHNFLEYPKQLTTALHYHYLIGNRVFFIGGAGGALPPLKLVKISYMY